jgi:hypothetical protein
MMMIENLIKFFKKTKEETTGKAPEGVCPNCWGAQEYDNKVRELYRDKQIDVNNHEANYAFIQDFVVNNINGIKLIRDGERSLCPSCRTNY